MAEITIKEGDTRPIKATLPRNMEKVDTVELLVGEEETVKLDAVITDVDNNEVAAPIGDANLTSGSYPVMWRITYQDGVTESIPSEGFDHISVSEALEVEDSV